MLNECATLKALTRANPEGEQLGTQAHLGRTGQNNVSSCPLIHQTEKWRTGLKAARRRACSAPKKLALPIELLVWSDFMPLDPYELHLRAACAYLELGMFDEAQAEMEKSVPLRRLLPEVLATRIPLYRAREKWHLMAIVARKLTEWNPEKPEHFVDWASAIRHLESIDAAHAILTRAAGLHPNDGAIQFNLAFYEAQLGNVPKAKMHLKCAVGIDPKYRLTALEVPDLEPLWGQLSGLAE